VEDARQFLREPLVHFLLLGAGLFVVFGVLNKGPSKVPEKIVVTAGQIKHLKINFAHLVASHPRIERWRG